MRSHLALGFAVPFIFGVFFAWANWQGEDEQRQLRAQGFDRSLLLLADRADLPEASSSNEPIAEGPQLGASFLGSNSLAAIRGWMEVETVFPMNWQTWEYETNDGGRETLYILGVHQDFVEHYRLGDAGLIRSGDLVFAGPPPAGFAGRRIRLNMPDEALRSVLAQIPSELHEQVVNGSSTGVNVSAGSFTALPGGSGRGRMAYLDRVHSALPSKYLPADIYIVRLRSVDQVEAVKGRIDQLFSQDRPTPYLQGRVERVRDAFPRPLSGAALKLITRSGAMFMAALVAALVFLQLAVDVRRNGLELALRRSFGNSIVGSIRDTLARPLGLIASGALAGALVGSIVGHASFPSDVGPLPTLLAALFGLSAGSTLFLGLALRQVTRSPFLVIRQYE